MLQFKRSHDLSKYLETQRQSGKTIGFVPTMGALHQGHISLLNRSAEQSDISVCSIFVNPTQFNDPLDFEKYPVTPEQDTALLVRSSTSILFHPGKDDIYPSGTSLEMSYDLGFLEDTLEGSYRPGHFQGVCQVVHRLLNIVTPDLLFLGQKDYQQCMVLRKLLSITDMDEQTKLMISPTLREKDGLAMSSRNRRLSPEQREIAPAIYQELNNAIQNRQQLGNSEAAKLASLDLEQKGFRVDYLEFRDAKTLEQVDDRRDSDLVILVAAYLGDIRLIDNILLES